MAEPKIPSAEAVKYGRRVVGRLIDAYERFARQARRDADREKARRHDAVAGALRRDLYGYPTGGGEVAAFDERWLDPDFREAMRETWEASPHKADRIVQTAPSCPPCRRREHDSCTGAPGGACACAGLAHRLVIVERPDHG